MSTKILTGTMTVLGTEYPISFDPLANLAWPFEARVDGRPVRASTYGALETKIRAELRKRDVTVAIEFVDADTGRVGTAYRIHGGTGRPMIRWADGTKSDRSDVHRSDVRTPLRHDVDVAELRDRRRAVRDAQDALAAFLSLHRLGKPHETLGTLVRDAITAAAESSADADPKGTPVQ